MKKHVEVAHSKKKDGKRGGNGSLRVSIAVLNILEDGRESGRSLSNDPRLWPARTRTRARKSDTLRFRASNDHSTYASPLVYMDVWAP